MPGPTRSTSAGTTRSGRNWNGPSWITASRTYSIFLDPETRDLFGYVEFDSEERWRQVASTEVCRRWWRHMRALMPSNPDDSPISRDLREVFHIDRGQR